MPKKSATTAKLGRPRGPASVSEEIRADLDGAGRDRLEAIMELLRVKHAGVMKNITIATAVRYAISSCYLNECVPAIQGNKTE